MAQGKGNEGIDIGLAIRASGGGFWAYDLRTHRVYWDDATRAMFGVAEPPNGLEEFLNLVHPDDAVDIQELIAGIGPQDAVTLEYRTVTPDGATRWMQDCFHVEFEDDEPVAFHGTVFDITHRKRLEAEVVEMHKDEALARLSANAARDFDNLITVILSSTELVSNEELSATTRQLVETIRVAAEQASELTRGMLLFGERAESRPALTEIGTMLGAATPILRQGLGRQHTLNIEVRDTPLYVFVDPAQLQLMLLNLVVNARHAMPTGGTVSMCLRRVRLEGRDAADLDPGSYVSLVVQDEGIGIDEDALPMIFEPFFTTRGPGEGAGLGLAAVRGIVRAAGGTIQARSAPDAGTRFEIFLPLKSPPHDDRTAQDVELTLGQRETVLFVDDDPMIQRVFKSVLTEFGFEVDAYGSAVDALDALEHADYDILVTDVVMPEMSGIELAETVTERWPGMPLVLLSGREDDDGRYEYLLKPIRPSGLALKIRQMLDGR